MSLKAIRNLSFCLLVFAALGSNLHARASHGYVTYGTWLGGCEQNDFECTWSYCLTNYDYGECGSTTDADCSALCGYTVMGGCQSYAHDPCDEADIWVTCDC